MPRRRIRRCHMVFSRMLTAGAPLGCTFPDDRATGVAQLRGPKPDYRTGRCPDLMVLLTRLLPTASQSPQRCSAPPRAPHGRWATCIGRSPGSRLERLATGLPDSARRRRQWHADGRRLAAYSCGGSRGMGRIDQLIRTVRHRVPFSPAIRLDCEDRHRAIKLRATTAVNCPRQSPAAFPWTRGSGATAMIRSP